MLAFVSPVNPLSVPEAFATSDLRVFPWKEIFTAFEAVA